MIYYVSQLNSESSVNKAAASHKELLQTSVLKKKAMQGHQHPKDISIGNNIAKSNESPRQNNKPKTKMQSNCKQKREEPEKKSMKPNMHIYNDNSIKEISTNSRNYVNKNNTKSFYQEPTPQSNASRIISRGSKFTSKENFYREMKLKGIRNIGNTCFINSIFQVLLNIPQFISDACNSLSKVQFNSSSLIREICLIYIEYYTNNKSYIQINNFFEVLREKIPYLSDKRQHDVAEFFQLLAESCENEILPYLCSTLSNKSDEILFSKTQMLLYDPFMMNFGFSIITNVVCGTCGKVITEEIQTNFILHIPLVYSTLKDCLAQTFQKEPIQIAKKKDDHNNQYASYDTNNFVYYCNNCNNSTSFFLSSSFYRIPRFLFIQIERFDSTLTKNTSSIDVPNHLNISHFINDTYFAPPNPIKITSREQLDIESFCSNLFESNDSYSFGKAKKNSKVSSIYEDEKMKQKVGYPNAKYHLISVILHEGSFSGGHYTTAIPSQFSREGSWSIISDDAVLENKVFNRSAPYCFIYQIDQ
ncbi:Ubiquitin carboxyl-terminal hydrolase 26 [Tritrichomonas musculus]|uniref:Ubiquitin carboxyl-terminal hydrolase n=1 Tax=Tritrichomonas musculus TaxID=1915356 RepID=A0ABR2K4L1_9EUKA